MNMAQPFDTGSALQEAVATGHREMVVFLLKHGDQGSLGDTGRAVHEAVLRGHGDMLNILLEYGASVDGNDSEGNAPLHVVIENGEVDMLRSLLIMGAHTNALGREGRTPLNVAVECGNTAMVEALLAAGAEDSVQCGRFNKLAVHIAAEGGQVDILKALIDRGGDVNALSGNHNTALHYAARKSRGDVIDVLVAAGANVRAQAVDGCTPLHDGAGVSSHEAVLALLRHGGDANAKGRIDCTPLHYAVARAGNLGNARVVDLLLKSGADETIVNADGRTPAGVLGDGTRLSPNLQDVERVRVLLANAPADKAWRRRGFLTMCRAHPHKLDPGQQGTEYGASGAGTSGGAGEGSTFVEVSRANWPHVMARVLGLQEEGIFRKIVGFF